MWVVLSVDCPGRWPRWTWRQRATWTVTVWWTCLSRSVVPTTSSISHLAMQDATMLRLIERWVILSYPSVSRCDIVKSRPYQLLCFDVCCPWNLKVQLLKLKCHICWVILHIHCAVSEGIRFCCVMFVHYILLHEKIFSPYFVVIYVFSIADCSACFAKYKMEQLLLKYMAVM